MFLDIHLNDPFENQHIISNKIKKANMMKNSKKNKTARSIIAVASTKYITSLFCPCFQRQLFLATCSGSVQKIEQNRKKHSSIGWEEDSDTEESFSDNTDDDDDNDDDEYNNYDSDDKIIDNTNKNNHSKSQNRRNRRKVHFSSVHIREYNLTIGDYYTSIAFPICMDWSYLEKETIVSLNEHEYQRIDKRRNTKQKNSNYNTTTTTTFTAYKRPCRLSDPKTRFVRICNGTDLSYDEIMKLEMFRVAMYNENCSRSV